jgi:hypothetical protein
MESGAKIDILLSPVARGTDVVVAKAPIASIADLKGKSFAVSAPGSPGDVLGRLLLQKNGVDPGQVQFVGLGSPADRIKALLGGKVDSTSATILVIEPVLEAIAKGDVKVLANLGEYFPAIPLSYILAQESMVKSRHDVMVRFVRGYIEGCAGPRPIPTRRAHRGEVHPRDPGHGPGLGMRDVRLKVYGSTAGSARRASGDTQQMLKDWPDQDRRQVTDMRRSTCSRSAEAPRKVGRHELDAEKVLDASPRPARSGSTTGGRRPAAGDLPPRDRARGRRLGELPAECGRLAIRHRTLLVDLPRFGRSEKVVVKGRGSTTCRAPIARSWTPRAERAHFVGNSMGGQVALKIAIDTPERVGRMVLSRRRRSRTASSSPMPTETVRMIADYYYAGEGPATRRCASSCAPSCTIPRASRRSSFARVTRRASIPRPSRPTRDRTGRTSRSSTSWTARAAPSSSSGARTTARARSTTPS